MSAVSRNLALLSVLALAVVFAGCPPSVDVPNVVGEAQEAAQAAIVAAGLTVGTVTQTYNATVPAGEVISQDPAAGTSVAAAATVDLVVSQGQQPPANVLVPDVLGMAQAIDGGAQNAAAALSHAGLVVGNVTSTYSKNVLAGLVLAQNPVAGTSVLLGASVDLVVSGGPPPVVVPNVAGLSRAAAQGAITEAGLMVAVTLEYSAAIPAGFVISQDPAPGVTLLFGQTVQLVVSQGPQSVPVPNVTGMSETNAQAALTAAGLALGTVTQAYSATVPAGQVISQTPTAGSSVAPGTTVDVVISEGLQPVNVPSVVGMTQVNAQTTLTGAGLVLGTVTQAYSATVPAGEVVSQTPTAGSSVAPGTAVDVVISEGPQPVNVPSVVGMTQTNAQTALTGAGLVLGTVTQASSATVPSGEIISQTPTAGSSAAPGTAVAVVISEGPQPVNVPSVVGMTQTNAQTTLTGAGLVLGTVTQASSATVPAGEVISQTPTADSSAAPGTAVDVVISEGPQPVNVPSVVGMTQVNAQTTLTGAGLVLGTVTKAYSATVPVGEVISQTPTADSSAAPGTAVDVVISEGPQPVNVPSVVGMTQVNAQTTLTGAGLVLGTVTQAYSATVPVGEIISQTPVADSSAAPGTAVAVVISEGPQPVSVPDVVGMPRAAAEATITAALLSLGTISQQYSLIFPVDDVINESPVAGTGVLPGSPVDLAISLGPLFVPDVVGMPQAAAQATLTASLLSLGTISRQYSLAVPVDDVIKETPAAGAGVLPGMRVDLVISNGPLLVPDVVGMPQAAAQALIVASLLTPGTISQQYSATVPAGDVISESPAAGSGVLPGAPVDLVISLGPQSVLVPEVTGMTQSNAQTALTSAGLTLGTVTQAYSATIPVGQVISQDPTASSSVLAGTAVNTVISVGESPMVPVSAGTFTMGNSGVGDDLNRGAADELPAHSVFLNTYQIGKYDVTNQEYADMLNWALGQGYLTNSNGDAYDGTDVYAAGQMLLSGINSSSQILYSSGAFSPKTETGLPGTTSYSMAAYPVVGITWYGATMYCNWLSQSQGLTPCYDTSNWACDFTATGYHLPTEAQWERAAAWDGAKHWIYGFTSDTLTGNSQCNWLNNNPLGLTTEPYTSPVGWFNGINVSPNGNVQTLDSRSPAGCYDMSGNVWQWCNDMFDSSYYQACQAQGTVADPPGPVAISQPRRIVRGGTWAPNILTNANYCRTALRSDDAQTLAAIDIGFRPAIGPLRATVPDVTGKMPGAAETTITDVDLTVGTITYQYSATVPEGRIISQNPTAGSSVAPGSAVDFVISEGPQPVTVPDVTGKTQADAQTALTTVGLTLGTVTQAYSVTVPSGEVISQTPTANSSALPGTAVAVVISEGPQPVTVPDVTGMTQSDAQTALTGVGLVLGTVTQAYSATVPSGEVISQTPTANSSALPGTAVAVVISEGPQPVPVPDVTGKTQADAQTALTGAGLTLGTVTQAYSTTVPSGEIISQTPTANSSALPGSAVAVVISEGPQPVTVPDVTGMTQADAQTALTGVGLILGTVTQAYSATVPSGEIISQTPTANSSALPGTAVDVVISEGPQPVTVPDVTGMTQADAQTALTGVGLVLGTVTQAYSATVPSGEIISQTPTANSSALPGTAVDVVISEGPQPVTVPDVMGMTQSDAQTALTGAGLTLGTVTQAYSDTVPLDEVISQNPTANSSALPGTAVDVVISEGPQPPAMIDVPAGTFTMGNSGAGNDATYGNAAESPAHGVQLSAYQIAQYDVTNQEYAGMLNWLLGQGYLTNSSGDAYDGTDVYAAGVMLVQLTDPGCQIQYSNGAFSPKTETGLPGTTSYAMDTHPVVDVTWYGAAVYCYVLSVREGLTPCYDPTTWNCDFTANGYHLPTEAQWERAAAWDGTKHWIYGFASDTLTGKDRCNYADNNPDFVNPLGLIGYPFTSPVGWFNGTNVSPNGNVQTVDSPSPVGCYDMSGNVYQWCNDWYSSTYYGGGAMTDPTGPASGLDRVARGGTWSNPFYFCRTAYRGSDPPADTNHGIGFRVTLGPAPVTAPDVVGDTQADAQTALMTAGLTVTVTYQYDGTVPAGQVISESPAAGSTLPAGTTVTLVVSGVQVPDVTSQQQSDAQTTLTGVGLTLGTVTQAYSDTVAFGAVISEDPAAGSVVAPGSAVAVVISEGPQPPAMIDVPAGTFTMGSSGVGDDATYALPDELPAHGVQLSAYQIAQYDVTNLEYADTLNWLLGQGYLTNASGDAYDGTDVYAAGVMLLQLTDPGCQIQYSNSAFSPKTETGVPGTTSYAMDTHPVVDVTWYGAAAHCYVLSIREGLTPCYDPTTWACDFTANGYHLPTEAQWERAAAWDGAKHWIYGFASDTLTGKDRCNYADNNPDFVNPLGLIGYPFTSPVGWFNGTNVSPNGNVQTVDSPSPAGCYDMSGNVYQWCNDWYSSTYYTGGAMTDPTGPTSGSDRVTRGGFWGIADCRTAHRLSNAPASADIYSGFRVAVGPAPVTAPDVVGDTQADAQTALTTAGLTVTITYQYDGTVPAGQVISESPAAGSTLPAGTTVTLVVSGVQVPDVTNDAQADAQTAITAAGLTVGLVTQQYSATVPDGYVISQDPAAASVEAPNSAVNLVVCLGGPIPIASMDDLQKIGNDLAYPLSGNYMQTQDLDASATSGFAPIGGGSGFTGTFDGQGHVISGLTINSSSNYVGLFGLSTGILENIVLDGGSVTTGGSGYTGGLCGENDGTVSNCSSSANVSGGGDVGGLCGALGNGTVSHCSASGAVSSSEDNAAVGGLIGGIPPLPGTPATVTACYAIGTVFKSGNDGEAGGLVGAAGGPIVTITMTDCYATGAVVCSATNIYAGGLIGYVFNCAITNCYSTGMVSAGAGSTVGGMIGGNSGTTVTSSYWDTDASGVSTSAGGTGEPTSAMMTQATFVGWDFVNVWNITEGATYPFLR